MTLEQMSNLSRVAVAERTKQFFYLHHTNKTNKFGCHIDASDRPGVTMHPAQPDQ